MKEDFIKIPILGFYGFSNSGKTSMIFKLIRRLGKAGYQTAVVKQTDKAISSEPQEKDTYGYRAAGAKITSFSSLNETNFVISKNMKTGEIIDNLLNLEIIDIVFVEGANDPDIKKVRLGNIPLRENTIYDYENDFEKLYQLILKMI